MRARALLLVVACTVSCASLNLKQQAATDLQAVQTALGVAPDFERANYPAIGLDTPASDRLKSFCPTSLVELPMTATKHQVISCFFALAFDAQVKAAVALLAWKPGDPSPLNIAVLQADVDLIFSVAQDVTPGLAQQQLVQQIHAAIEAVLSTLKMINAR